MRNNEYYHWMIDQVSDRYYDNRYYSKLLFDLDNIEYTWSISLDENRAKDGLQMRYEQGCDRKGMPCSILEMMVALSLRVVRDGYISEDEICTFFWDMIKTVGLYFNDDYNYDSDLTDERIANMLNHEYNYDGSDGALFIVNEPRNDMRDTQIWMQAMWHIAEVDRERNGDWLG